MCMGGFSQISDPPCFYATGGDSWLVDAYTRFSLYILFSPPLSDKEGNATIGVIRFL